MSASEARLVHQTALIISALVVLRLIAAAWTPLTFDEAYYWTGQKIKRIDTLAPKEGFKDEEMAAILRKMTDKDKRDEKFGEKTGDYKARRAHRNEGKG